MFAQNQIGQLTIEVSPHLAEKHEQNTLLFLTHGLEELLPKLGRDACHGLDVGLGFGAECDLYPPAVLGGGPFLYVPFFLKLVDDVGDRGFVFV